MTLTYLVLALVFWAVTAVVAYWWFYTPASAWVEKYNQAQAELIGPLLSREPAAIAVSRTKRALYIVEISLFVVGLLVSKHPLFGLWALGVGLFGIR